MQLGAMWVATTLLSASALLGATPTTGTDEAQEPRTDFTVIDGYIESEMAAARVPGMAVGVVRNGQVVHVRGWGGADGGDGRPVTPSTPFVIGSVSKSFTALAVMQLVEAGDISLDEPVRTYIPWFTTADHDASGRITVRHLLNQTSGLSEGDQYLFTADGDPDALSDQVRSMRTLDLNRDVGASFEYVNLNYTVLGLVVQLVSGQTYEQYVADHIFAPLGMTDTYAAVPDAQRHGLATGHQFWFDRPVAGGGLPYNRAATPAGLLSSSAADMSRYLIAQLDGGRYQGDRVLSAAGMDELQQGGPDVAGSAGPSYAMGWFDSEWDDGEAEAVRIVSHSGDTRDFQASAILAPRSGWGVVLLANGSNTLRPATIDTISTGVMSRLVGVQGPSTALLPPPFDAVGEPIVVVFGLVLVVVVLQLLGVVRSVVLLRRWRARPERRPQTPAARAVRIVGPLVANLVWALLCLVALPGLFGIELLYLVNPPTDRTLLVLSGALALVWGVLLRPVLATLAVREHKERTTP